MSRTNYIFVDFENIQTIELDRIAGKPVKVILVLGPHHKRLELGLVKMLLKYVAQVELIETGRPGKNALDMVLSSHIGLKRAADPNGYFHILSRDKHFDPLIEHWRINGTLSARREAFSEIPIMMNENERVNFIVEHYKPKHITRPKSRKTLESDIQRLFGKALTQQELAGTIKVLMSKKTIDITPKDEVIYRI